MRDYNIINNKYLELHDEKNQIDKEVERLNAAKKYWQTHDFDAVNGEYYDKDKEGKYCVDRDEQA